MFFAVDGIRGIDRSRGPQAAVSRFTESIAEIAGFVMPGLMLVGALLARRNVKLGRGDRRGAFRAAPPFFSRSCSRGCSATRTCQRGAEVSRFFARVGIALFNAALLWLTYLGLEPYVRRFSPDSLIGWTRLVAGGWRDPRVGRDVHDRRRRPAC